MIVEIAIHRGKNTAPGPDSINRKTMKQLPNTIYPILALLMNACLKFAYFSRAWKSANTVMIPKPDETLDPKDPVDVDEEYIEKNTNLSGEGYIEPFEDSGSEYVTSESESIITRISEKTNMEISAVSVNKTVVETQAQQRRRKTIILPTANDIKLLKNHLRKKARIALNNLKLKFDFDNWISLEEVTVIYVVQPEKSWRGEAIKEKPTTKRSSTLCQIDVGMETNFCYSTVSPYGKVKNKKRWTNVKRETALRVFKENIQNHNYPFLKQIQIIQKEHPALKDRSEVVIKTWICNQIEKK
ncbi:hypothetical protein JTB14_025396 [Gonioctena quinquepunctata]|nr:hypothetical protein JTB14_025396 [Gonioctena quinquepunctata]